MEIREQTAQTIRNLSVRELAEAIRSRKLTPNEAAQAYLQKIAETTPVENGYLSVSDGAGMPAGNPDSPLFGVPYAVKDNLAVRGMRMTCASRILESFVPPYHASVVEKIGGWVLGKTNLDEFAMGSSTETSSFGVTRNPLDPTRSAGGSSGGSAAVIAAGLAPWALGSDTGGSARQPAAFCGIVAMKPTWGLVSRFGLTEFASSMDTVCPMTRDVRDNALALTVIQGRDPRDMTSLDAHECYLDGIDAGVRGLRVAWMRDALCDRGQQAAMVRTAQILERLGASVEPVALPDSRRLLDTYLVLASAECSSNLARYDGIKYGRSAEGAAASEIMKTARRDGFGDEVKRRILAGTYALSTSVHADGESLWQRFDAERDAVTAECETIFGKYDLILMPTASGTAFPLGSCCGDPTAMYESDCFTVLANLTGCPAITFPCGGDGVLPYGAMLMGPRRSEKMLYRVAYALEDSLAEAIREEVRRHV